MLETPSISRYRRVGPPSYGGLMTGNDPSSADDQQERPGFEQWVVGFVDGEGCSSVPICRNRNAGSAGRFSQPSLWFRGLGAFASCASWSGSSDAGGVVLDRRHDDHREDLYRFEVRALGDLRDRILPFFEANPLRTAKRGEFERFSRVVRMMGDRSPLTEVGLARIARIAEKMNHRKPSRFLESSEAIRQPTPVDVRS
jgi:hypothetical protein